MTTFYIIHTRCIWKLFSQSVIHEFHFYSKLMELYRTSISNCTGPNRIRQFGNGFSHFFYSHESLAIVVVADLYQLTCHRLVLSRCLQCFKEIWICERVSESIFFAFWREWKILVRIVNEQKKMLNKLVHCLSLGMEKRRYKMWWLKAKHSTQKNGKIKNLSEGKSFRFEWQYLFREQGKPQQIPILQFKINKEEEERLMSAKESAEYQHVHQISVDSWVISVLVESELKIRSLFTAGLDSKYQDVCSKRQFRRTNPTQGCKNDWNWTFELQEQP